jgi:hypothetical protein
VKQTRRFALLGLALGVLISPLTADASAAAADPPEPAVLTAVDLTESAPKSCQFVLRIDGVIDEIETASLGDGRFVFDLSPVRWDGPTRRTRPDSNGIREYRFSQLSRDPLVTRFVVEVSAGWSCRHDSISGGLLVVCSGPPIFEAQRSAAVGPTIAVVRGLELTSPLVGVDAETLIDRSLGFTPRDVVRDGLPNFGSVRDDWMGAPRPHKGLDIYVDKAAVQAVARGKVVGVGHGDRAGGWVKIDHGNGVETVYVHVSKLKVKTGDDVSRGQQLAAIHGAVGNAVEPQLHFELRLDGEATDPVPFIFDLASEDLKRTITLANQRLEVLERERAARVRQVPRQ